MSTNNTKTKPEAEQFLDVNAMSNAVDYLESAANFLGRNDDFKWKWVALAVHHALYGFCVTALEHGNPEWVLATRNGRDDEGAFCKPGNRKRWSKSKRSHLDAHRAAYRIEWVETDEQPPKPKIPNAPDDPFAWTKGKLISFWTSLARIQDGQFWMARYVYSKPVAITDQDLKAIQWLGLRVRNELIHFVPKHWGISVQGVQAGCLAAVKVIESLVFESESIHPVDEETRIRIRHAIDGLRKSLSPH